MNLSIIERMLAQGDVSLDALRYLVGCRSECEWLDYKEIFAVEQDCDAPSFTKHAIAMKNVGGGYILVGVQDKTWKPIGIKERIPYDSKMLRDKIRKCSGHELDVDIVHHAAFGETGTGLFAMIQVRGSSRRKKRRVPVKDFRPKDSFGLHRPLGYEKKSNK